MENNNWVARRQFAKEETILIVSRDGATVACCDENSIVDKPRNESNARLIAASPDMLSCLKLVVAHKGIITDSVLSAIKVAIAKAEGH